MTMNITTIEWKNNSIKVIDQSKLPLKLEYIRIKDLKVLHDAIRKLKVRGAPALGAAAALGVYLGVKDSKAKDIKNFSAQIDRVTKYLASSRPTARNLFWGLERMRGVVMNNKEKGIPEIKKLLFKEANDVVQEDRAACRNIGKFGSKLLKNGDAILTVCNAGILATIDYGTALGVIYTAKKEGKHLKVFSCETRPVMQGSRLTTWELKQNGIDTVLICDNMAATLMQQGKVTKVIAGADRIAANGDAANKIGTYSLAVLARHHKIPFFIAAPRSTFDIAIRSGRQIPIEQRDPAEVTHGFFKEPMAPEGVKVYNPAFDVTPNALITAIITDYGVLRAPYDKNIRKIFKG